MPCALHQNHSIIMTMAVCLCTTLPDSVFTPSYLNQSERLSQYLEG